MSSPSSSPSSSDESPFLPSSSLIAPPSYYNPDLPTGYYNLVKHQLKPHRQQALYRFRVENVRNIVREYSPTFYVQNMPWRIMAVVHENVETQGEELTFTKKFGLFLHCYGVTEKDDWAVFTRVNMDVWNQIPEKLSIRRRFSHFFYKDKPDYGFYSLLDWEQLTNESLGFVKKGTLVVEVVLYSERAFIIPRKEIERPFTINNFVVPDALAHLYTTEDH